MFLNEIRWGHRVFVAAGLFCLALVGGLTPMSAQAADCPKLINRSFDRLQDDQPQSLCQYQGQVILVVNTASYCGFTSQYEGLEKLYATYKDRGLVVLGFPSNDFSQEPGSNKEIAEFCTNTFSVKFPMFAKSSVKGAKANPLFKDLAQKGGAPQWNFHKYLIGRNGEFITSYSSLVGPSSSRVVKDVEAALSAK